MNDTLSRDLDEFNFAARRLRASIEGYMKSFSQLDGVRWPELVGRADGLSLAQAKTR